MDRRPTRTHQAPGLCRVVLRAEGASCARSRAEPLDRAMRELTAAHRGPVT